MKIERMWPEDIILDEIKSGECTRDNVALTYAFCLDYGDKIDWKNMNMAIIERWSMSGLKYIKSKAWKLSKEKEELLRNDI